MGGDNRLIGLEIARRTREKHEDFVQSCMNIILYYLLSVQRKNKHLYVIAFNDIQEVCCIASGKELDNYLLTQMIVQNNINSVAYYFNDEKEVDQVFHVDIYNWLKSVYPTCKLSSDKLNLSEFDEHDYVRVYHYSM